MASVSTVRVQVAYALAERQVVLTVAVPADATIERAIRASGIIDCFPEIDLARQAVGVFGARAELADTIRAGDRIEIYRPLQVDPKEARRRRAEHKRTKGL